MLKLACWKSLWTVTMFESTSSRPGRTPHRLRLRSSCLRPRSGSPQDGRPI